MSWWIFLLIKVTIPLLVKWGVIDEAEALAIKSWYAAKNAVKDIKVYSEPEGSAYDNFPTGKNGDYKKPAISSQLWKKEP